MPRLRFGTLLITAAFALSGCAAGDSAGVKEARADSAGVELVAVSGSRPMDWRFRERWRAGGDDEGPTAFSRLGDGSVAATPQGGIVVIDRVAHHVVVLSGDGEVTRVLGREGEGPGELGFPASVAVLADGSIWVYDIGKSAIVRFGPDGEALPEVRVSGLSYSTMVRPGADGVRMLQRDASQDSLRQFLVELDASGVRDTIRMPTLPVPQRVDVPGCNVSIPIGKAFEPRALWDSWGSRVPINAGTAYVVDVYEGARLRTRLRREVDQVPVTESMAVRQYPDGFKIGLPSGTCTADAAQMVRAQGYAAFLPSVANLHIAPGGEIWVLRGHVAEDPAEIDIWSSDGSYEGTLPAGTPFPVAFLVDGSPVTIETDELDVPQLVVWIATRAAGKPGQSN